MPCFVCSTELSSSRILLLLILTKTIANKLIGFSAHKTSEMSFAKLTDYADHNKCRGYISFPLKPLNAFSISFVLKFGCLCFFLFECFLLSDDFKADQVKILHWSTIRNWRLNRQTERSREGERERRGNRYCCFCCCCSCCGCNCNLCCIVEMFSSSKYFFFVCCCCLRLVQKFLQLVFSLA